MVAIVVGGALVGAVGFYLGDIINRSTTGAFVGATVGSLVPYTMILCVPITVLYLMWLFGSYRQQLFPIEAPSSRTGLPMTRQSSSYDGGGRLIPLNHQRK